MRLVFVSHSLPPEDRPLASIGGMQRVALELHGGLLKTDRLDYHPIMLRSSWALVHFRVLPFLIGTSLRLRRLIRSGEVDVILFSSTVTALLTVPLRSLMDRHGVRAAAIVHGQDVTKPVGIWQRLVRGVFRRIDLVMPVSSATGEACVERGLDPAKVHVVNNGVDVERFESAAAERAGSRSGAGLLLVSVGRQVERKGFAWFIEHVMPRLPDHIEYRLAGDGPQADAIDEAIAAGGLTRRVRRLGRVTESELLDLYAEADLFIMPNIPVPGDMEGFGIVMLEAGMAGVPTVASRLEGIREVITEGENGYFVETGDAEGFVAKILELDNDREGLARLSDRTRRHVRTTFGWEAVTDHYVDALLDLAR